MIVSGNHHEDTVSLLCDYHFWWNFSQNIGFNKCSKVDTGGLDDKKNKKIRGFSIINSMEAENIFKFQLLVVEIGRHLEKKASKSCKTHEILVLFS